MSLTSEKSPADTNSDKKPAAIEDARLPSFDVAAADDILSLQDVDPALNAKMHIVNNVCSANICGLLKYHRSKNILLNL